MSEAEIWDGESPLSYAKVGGPPANWYQVEVIDLASGEELSDVIEANASEGWAIVYRIEDRKPVVVGGKFILDRIVGRLEIRLRRP